MGMSKDSSSNAPPSLDEIRRAAERIAPYIHHTPIHTSRTLDEMSKCTLFFKCENFQRIGAFKFRGACNAVQSLNADEAERGVVTHSSGNHAQALALAAQLRGIRAHVIMPRTASAVKKAAVQGYGGIVIECEPTLQAREEAVEVFLEEAGATLIHPYNDYRIIAGQGTAALELAGQVEDLDAVVVPIGGGGLASGTALALNGLSSSTRIIAAEPKGADDAYRSLKAGKLIPSENPKTIADGLLTSLGDLTYPIIQSYVDDIVLVPEPAIGRAMRLVWERMKIIIEPSAAVAVAAVFETSALEAGSRVGIILSGGNVDLEKLPW